MRNEVLEEVALERISILFSLALKKTLENSDSSSRLARRYVRLAREISTHYKIKMPKEIKRSVCSRCDRILVPGLTCSVRLASSSSFIVYKCACGKETRVRY